MYVVAACGYLGMRRVTSHAVQDIEGIDPTYYNSLKQILEHPIEDMGLDLVFTSEVEVLGEVKEVELCPGGADIEVTDENKLQYVQLVAAHRMTAAIQVCQLACCLCVSVPYLTVSLVCSPQPQIDAFLEGFHMQIPAKLLRMFNEHELELLISGLPTIDGTCPCESDTPVV